MTVSTVRALKYHAASFESLTRKKCGKSSAPAAVFMWPIILCSIASVAIILERLWTLQSSRVIPRDLSQKVYNWIEADQLSDKLVIALEQNSPLGKLLAIGSRTATSRARMAGAARGRRPPTSCTTRALPQHLGHGSRRVAPLCGLWARRGHHSRVQCHHRQRARRSANPVRRHRRGSDHARRGAHRGDSLPDRVPVPGAAKWRRL